MKKIISIILTNIFVILFAILILDLITYTIHYKKETDEKIFSLSKMITNYRYRIFNPPIYLKDTKSYFHDNEKKFLNSGKKPYGLEYNDTPITIFGCSFAYGQGLKDEDTFAYKLSHILKRPIYNRAVTAGSPQIMYHQVLQQDFYDDVPYSDTVIYIMIDDHYRRMITDSFDITTKYLYLKYSLKNNELVPDDYNNTFLNLVKSIYTLRFINQQIYRHKLYFSNKDAEKLTDLFLAYCIKTREKLELYHNKKINFVFIIYDWSYDWLFNWSVIPYRDLLINKLEKNGFTVIYTQKLTKEPLNNEKYMNPDKHPNAKAWELLTPIIVKELQQKNIL